MKTMIRITGWSILFCVLAVLFYVLSPTEASACRDDEISLRVRTENGITEMTMADYLPGAVAAEMPISFGPEALKAQAVAARTYALAAARHDDADVCTDSGCCLAWLDEPSLRALWGPEQEENLAAVREAVRATDGQILTYGGQAIQAAFHASSAGSTEDSGSLWSPLPYLISVPTPETEALVPGLITRAAFTPEELCTRLALTPEGPPESWLGPVTTDPAGRAASITIAGTELDGTLVRSALGLRSTAFTVRYKDGLFLFTTAGHGHGVGMSQYGAKLLAADGLGYDEILAHYYPGTTLTLFAP